MNQVNTDVLFQKAQQLPTNLKRVGANSVWVALLPTIKLMMHKGYTNAEIDKFLRDNGVKFSKHGFGSAISKYKVTRKSVDLEFRQQQQCENPVG